MNYGKTFHGYEGQYQASTLGRIRSLDRYVEIAQGDRKAHVKFRKGKILEPFMLGKGIKSRQGVTLNGKNKYVHQLVIKTFTREQKEGEQVRHLNGVSTDNRLENLEYGVQSENIRDIYMQGQAWRKLRVTEVSAIKHLLKGGRTPKELAEIYNVSSRTIYAIAEGGRHCWVK